MNILAQLISALLHVLPEDFVKDSVAKFVNGLRAKIIATPNKWDDLALPLLDAIEKQLGIK